MTVAANSSYTINNANSIIFILNNVTPSRYDSGATTYSAGMGYIVGIYNKTSNICSYITIGGSSTSSQTSSVSDYMMTLSIVYTRDSKQYYEWINIAKITNGVITPGKRHSINYGFDFTYMKIS